MPASYRDLIVWQKAMDLAQEVYGLTASFPIDERFGLTAQMRRSAVSIPSNTAEGHGRDTANDFRHFLSIARGSLRELETQVELALRVGLITASATMSIRERCPALAIQITRLIASQRERSEPQRGGHQAARRSARPSAGPQREPREPQPGNKP
jgi:four helix bundle protein